MWFKSVCLEFNFHILRHVLHVKREQTPVLKLIGCNESAPCGAAAFCALLIPRRHARERAFAFDLNFIYVCGLLSV